MVAYLFKTCLHTHTNSQNSRNVRKAIKKRKFIFLDFVRKGEGGSRTKPYFYVKIIWDPTLREGGAKLLFPKSKLLNDLSKNLLNQTQFSKTNRELNMIVQ